MNAFAQAERWRNAFPVLRFGPALECGLAILVILLFSSALLGQLFGDTEAGSAMLRLVWPPVYALILALVLMRPMPVLRLMVRAWPIIVLACLTLVSYRWSIDPGTTLRRGLGVVMTAVFAAWLASRYSWTDLIRLMALAFSVLIAGSFIMSLVFPQYGVMAVVHPGAWSGLWLEKNTLGAVMALGTLANVSAALMTPPGRERQFWIAGAVLALTLVLLSTSRTALLATMIGLLGPLAIAFARQGFIPGVLALFGGALAVFGLALVLVIGPGVLLEALGRDPTLTGRTDIWGGLISAIQARPWTGYGYGAFWMVEDGPVFWLRQGTQWDVPSAHNAWIEIALDLGVPGLALAVLSYFTALGRALKRLFSGPEIYWALPGLAVWGLTSMSESILMLQNGFTWMMFCMTFCKLAAPRDP